MVTEYSEFNPDNLLQHLLPISSKWKELGLALTLDEEQTLNDIASIHKTDEERLEGLLKLPNLKDSRLVDITAALKSIGEYDVATMLDPSKLKSYLYFGFLAHAWP